jgi:succinoglycan biosynthesis transport protein ExoP
MVNADNNGSLTTRRAMNMSAPEPVASVSASSIDMASLVRGIWRRKLMVLGLAVLFGLVAVAYVMTTAPTYTTESMVLIDNLDTPFDRAQPTDMQARQAIDERDVLSQVSVLTSRDLGERVVKQLTLNNRPEFDPLAKGLGLASRIAIALGFKSDPRSQTVEERAYGRYSGNLNVYEIPNSKVIVIRYSSTDPQTAAEVTNALAETYVLSTREAESEPTGRAREWLAQQIEALRKKVVETEAAAEEFRARAGLLKGTQATLGAQELQELNSQIVLAQAQRSDAEAKANSIRDLLARKGNVSASSEVLSSPMIQRLREDQTTLTRTRSELAVTYLPSHPKMAAVDSQLANIDRQIRAEALKIVDSLEDQAKVAGSREASLQASLDAAKARASGTNQDEVKLRALEREAAANRELLETFLNRFTDASARQDLTAQPGMARIIQRAAVPSSPSFPLPGPTILLAAVAGFMLGLGLAFLAEVMAASTATAEPVPAVAGARLADRVIVQPTREVPAPPKPVQPAPATAPETDRPVVQKAPEPAPAVSPAPAAADLAPALCELPSTPDTSAAIANAYQPIANPGGSYAGAMKLVTSWAISARQTLGVRRIAVAGLGQSAPDVAATVAGIARTLAGQGARTLIVDTDPSSAVLQVILGVPQGPGLAELLVGKEPFEAVIARDTASEAQYLRVGQNRAAVPALIASPHMEAVFDALGQVYDVVILHCGDAEGPGSLAVRKCHAAIVLAGAAGLADAARIIDALREVGLRAVRFLKINRPIEKAAAA